MRKSKIALSVLVIVLNFLVDFVLAQAKIIKSQWTNGYAIHEQEIGVGDNVIYDLQFFVWIVPQVGNSLINKMQIVRISNSVIINKNNESSSKVLLISVNTNEAFIQLESFDKVEKLNLLEAGINYESWTLIKINLLSNTKLSVLCGSIPKEIDFTNAVTPMANKKLYLYMGVETDLGILPFNGYYALSFDSNNSIQNLAAAPTSGWSNKGISNKLALLQKLGSSQTRLFETDNDGTNDQMIQNYSIKFSVQITGNFVTKKQILRMTIDPLLNDERNLGYCVVCVYVYKQDIIFETYSYDPVTTTYVISKKTFTIQNILSEINTPYSFVAQYNGNEFQVIDGKSKTIQKMTIKQIPLLGFAIIHGGNFISDTLFAGRFSNLMINYGENSIVVGVGDIDTYKTCQNKLCSKCNIAELDNCHTCLVSYNDPKRDPSPSTCGCLADYFFDINSKCSQCHSTCKTCEGPSYSECLTCIDTRQFPQGETKGSCYCKEKYFDDSLNAECKACHPNCLTCNGTKETNCQTCPVGRIVSPTGECVCKSNFFAENGECKQCKIQCTTCNNADTCLTCGENQTLDPTTKQCTCNSGYYEVKGSEYITCYKCTQYCKYCVGTGEQQCSVCENKFNLYISTNSTTEGSCVHKKFIQTQEFETSFFTKDENAIKYCVLVVVIIDLFANIYANKFGFSRVFRMQQFILKIFYLKLIDTDFLQSNYELLTSLSFFNGLNNLYHYMNPFTGLPTPPKAQDRIKIKLEEISMNVLFSSGGVIFIEILFFSTVIILTLMVKARNRPNTRAQSSSFFSNPNDNSMHIDRPMISARNDQPEQVQSHSSGEQSSSNSSGSFQNYGKLAQINNFMQHVYWHFHEYGLNVVCFGCILHLVGPVEEQQEVRPDNFICYLILLYIIIVCLFLRSWIIRKPKEKEDLLSYKSKAIENEKLLKERNERENRNRGETVQGIQVGNEDDDSEFTDVLANGNSPGMTARRQTAIHRNSAGEDRSQSNSSASDQSSEVSTKKASDQPNYKKWHHLLYLHDSICMHGIFECLHMEFIPYFKGGKFYFWIYLINYFTLAASVVGPHDSSSSQYVSLCFVQLLFMIVSFFRPYQDILESIKNIIDNVIFFIVVVLQFILSIKVQDDVVDFKLTGGNEKQLNAYSWACFSLLLLVMVAFMGLSIGQVILRRKNAALQQTASFQHENILSNNIQSSENQHYQPANRVNTNNNSNKDRVLADQFKNLRKGSVYQGQQQVGLQHSSLVQNQISQRKSVMINDNLPQFDPFSPSLGGHSQFDISNPYTRSLNQKREQKFTALNNNYQTLNTHASNYNSGNFGVPNGDGSSDLTEQMPQSQVFGNNSDYNSQMNYNQDFNILRHLQQGRQTIRVNSNFRSTLVHPVPAEIEMQDFQVPNNNVFSPNNKLILNTNSGGSLNPEEFDNSNNNPFGNQNTNNLGGSLFEDNIFNQAKNDQNLIQISNDIDHHISSPSEQFNINNQEFKS